MRHCPIIVILIALLAAAAARGQSIADLSNYLPRDANAVLVIDALSLYESSLGRAENWREKYFDASQSTTLMMPPSANQMIMAARLDVDTLTADWEAAVMRLSVDPTVAEIAERRGGTVDRFGNFEAVWLGGNTCLVKFAPNTFAILTPATRQEAARWVAQVASPQAVPLSPYLQQTLTSIIGDQTQIFLAVDLVNALPDALVRTAAAQSEILAAAPGIQAATLLTGLQGVRFGVRVDEQLHGALHIDFAGATQPLAPVAKPLILGILREAGAMLPEFDQWQAAAEGNSLTLAGQLSPEGLRRVLSLLTIDASAIGRPQIPPPAQPPSDPGDSPTPPREEKNPTVVASQRYFRAVGDYIEDAQRLERANSLRQSVMWLQNYARRVENLSPRYVDPELVQYGQYVSQTFRNVINQAYGVADKRAAIQALEGPSTVEQGLLPTGRTVTVPGYRFREYAPYYTAYSNQQQQLQAAQEQQKLRDQIYAQVEQARQTLNQLVADHEMVRSKLSQRYGVQFR